MTEASLSPHQQAKLAAMQDKFSADVPRRLEALREAWAQAAAQPEGDGALARWQTLHRLAHTLVGSAGTFGFSELSACARNLESKLVARSTLAGLTPLDAPERAAIEAALALLDDPAAMLVARQVASPAAALPAPVLAPVAVFSDAAAAPSAPRNRLLFWIEDDLMVAADAVDQLSVFGWDVRAFLDATDALAALQTAQPAAVIADINLPEGPLAGLELAAKIKSGQHAHVPVVMVSSRWDWETRLAAVRARADAYWVKPLDYARLDEQIEALTQAPDDTPVRVLVVDDDALLAARYAEVLQQAGIQVTTLTDATLLLDVLAESQPELLLIDLVMPDCSGLEAAAVVRQDPQFAGLPILFLSSEADPATKLAALRSGGDAYLEKSTDDDALVNAVRARTARFRTLRALIHQDPLTQALNLRAYARALDTALAQASVSAQPLSMVRLDIDHFKRVDARYGQAVADSVLSALARMLRHHLRAGEVLGRVWGDQFAVLLPGTTAAEAQARANTWRTQFESLRQPIGQLWFNCTFSAAVVSLDAQASPDAWNLAADAALACAKTEGRNRVCVAPPSPDQPN